MLGRVSVGIGENYFDLGGDSILSLQIIARARQLGLTVTPKQLFEHPTIEAVARVATETLVQRTETEEVHGDIPLTPIQSRFFERYPDGPAHWNQSLLLRVNDELSVAALEKALDVLVARHDALRLRFQRNEEHWTQRVAPDVQPIRVAVADLRDDPDWRQALENEGERVQQSLDLANGPLLQACCFRLPEGEARLLLVIHHLAVDGVSWRVILDELRDVYGFVESKRAIELSPVTCSFSRWALKLAAYRARPELRAELAWWRDTQASAVSSLPGLNEGDRSYGASRELLVRWTPADTRQLLEAAPRAYRMRVDEVLLTALVQTLTEWTDIGARSSSSRGTVVKMF